MKDSVRIRIAGKEFEQFFKKDEARAFLVLNTFFSVIVFSLDKESKITSFLISINTSLWAALIYYFIFNIYGNIEIKLNQLLTFKDLLDQKIRHFEGSLQRFIDEAVAHGLANTQNLKGFFSYVNSLPAGHSPTTQAFRVIKTINNVNGNLNYVYYDINDCCINEFDKSITSFKEIERLALSLQLRELDPFLYEKIYKLIETKASFRQMLLARTPMQNPHSGLASDLDMVATALKNMIDHLNSQWGLEISIREDLV